MKYTKCDIDADVATLDVQELTRQMELHFYSTLRKIQSEVDKPLDDSLSTESRKQQVFSMRSTGSNTLLMHANTLARTAELLDTLHESTTRKIHLVREEPSDGQE